MWDCKMSDVMLEAMYALKEFQDHDYIVMRNS